MNPEKSGEKNTRRRVKVYKLNDEGQWDDVGTGHVTCVHHETFDALALVVKSEEKGGENILESKIQIEDIYQLQQDTLIVWQEPETGLDLALSFQEEQGCKEVWEQICAVQGRNPSESSEEVVTEEESYFNGIKLPPANLNNLQKMNGVFDGEHNSHTKERLANTVTRENYLSKLIDLFKVVEESGNQEHLHLMFNIFKNLVLLNDPNLLETMFNDQNFMASVGALEYDPEVSPKLEHRKYLQNSVIFKEVVPIRNAEILKKIHQTFRVQYLKDVILPRLLDDMTFATINSIIYFNNVEIVDHLYKDTTFLIELFSKFKAASNDDLVDLLGFLQEFCSLAKNLQIPQQRDFYQALARHGMFEIFESALAEPNIKIRLSCADLVNNVLSHDPVHFREFLMAQRPDYVLFQKLVDRVLLETDVGLLSQFVEVIRILVDTETMEETPDKEKFLTLFYQTFMKGLMAPIMDVDAREREGADPAEFEMKSARRQELCELLAYCCQHHGYHIKYFILGNNIAAKVAKLLSHLQPKHVSLAALRFFRALVAAKDEFYNRHIIKFKLFDPIVQLFVANGKKYNLINSAVIELFDYIRKDNVKPLLKHVMENYAEVFKEVDYVETFKLLQLKYEQNKDHEENANKAYAAPTKSPQRAAGDDVDDSYFFGDDDDEEETAPSGLVAYEDDENSSRVAEEVGKGKRKWEGEKVEAEQELREEEEEEEEEEEDGGKEAPSLNEPVVTNGDASEAYDPSKKRKRPAAANHSGGGDGKAADGDGSSSSSTATSETKEEGGQGEEDGAKDMKEVNEGSSGGVAASTMGSTETGEKERDPKRLKFAIQSPKLPKISTSDS